MKGNVASANVLKKLGFNKVGEGKTYCVSRKEEVDCIHVALLKPIRLNKDNVIEAADRFNKKEEIWVPN
jgi:predicted amino acid racemase